MSTNPKPLAGVPPRRGHLLTISWIRTSDTRVGIILKASEAADQPALAYMELDGLHPTGPELLEAESRCAEAVHNYLWTTVGAQLALDLAGEESAESAVARVRGTQSP